MVLDLGEGSEEVIGADFFDVGIGIAPSEKLVDEVWVAGDVGQSDGEDAVDAVEIGAEADVVDADEIDDVVDVVGDVGDIRVGDGVFVCVLRGEVFGGLSGQVVLFDVSIGCVPSFSAGCGYFGVEEHSAEVDLYDAASFCQRDDHVVGEVSLPAWGEAAAGGVRGDDGRIGEAEDLPEGFVGDV